MYVHRVCMYILKAQFSSILVVFKDKNLLAINWNYKEREINWKYFLY